MLYFICGEDSGKSLAYFNSTVANLRTKRPEASCFAFNSENFDKSLLEEMVFGQTMFADKYLVSWNDLFGNQEAKDFFFENLKDLSDSKNLFIFREVKVEEEEMETIKKVAFNTRIFKSGVAPKDTSFFELFKITDAFGKRDKKLAWISLQKCLLLGFSYEEIFWKLVWQLKNMILAKKAENGGFPVDKLGIKPTVWAKSQSFARNFTEKELVGNYEKLLDIYYLSRRGELDFETSLERFLLIL